jgi:hypothetical protein
MSTQSDVMQRLLDAAGWDAGSLRHRQLQGALDGASLEIVSVAQQTPMSSAVRAAIEELYAWYDLDGSVGAASDVFERHRASIDAALATIPDERNTTTYRRK